MKQVLPPAPPVPRTKEQQQTAFSNAAFWTDWYTKLREVIQEIQTNLGDIVYRALGNQPYGYPLLDEDARINMETDIVINDSAVGLVLKSENGTYFRFTVNDVGGLITTNLGTTLP